ncbi:MAG: NUDIX hydrolase [Candidatus Magasanikbacteria bacterium]
MSFKTLSSEVIHQNPWSVYKHDTYELTDGSAGDYYYLETPGNAMVVPVLDDGRLLLVVQHRYLYSKQSVEFPCGGMKIEESPQITAERELLEETGYRSHNLIKAGVFQDSNGLLKDGSHLFIGNELEKISDPLNNSHENVEVIIRRPDEFEAMIKSGEIWDGQTLAAWAMVREYVNKIVSH